MPKYPSFFRADDEIEPATKGTPSPNEWFGPEKTKYRSSPTFSEDEEGAQEHYDGWREFQNGHPRDPMKNELLNDQSRENSLKFRDEQNDPRRLIFVLEHAAEVFEAEGHLDLAAECENLCELAISEE
jgi:hypothetical protein